MDEQIQHQQTGQRNTALAWGIAFLAVAFIAFAVVLYFKIFDKPPSDGADSGGASGTSSSSCYTAEEAWNHYGESHCVRYYIGNPFKSAASNVFLNEKRDFTNGFTSVIFANGPSCGDPINDFGYKTVEVNGPIQEYQNHPEIIINSCSQIKVVQ